MRVEDKQGAASLESGAHEMLEAVVVGVVEVEAHSENLFVPITDDHGSMVVVRCSHRYDLGHECPLKKDFGPDVSGGGIGLARKLSQGPEGEWTFCLSITHLDDVRKE
jgi:hypothetical protein